MIEVTSQNHEEPRVVVIGGGHGTAAVYPEIAGFTKNATAIISTSDGGGSTRGLRDEFGLPAMGDIANVVTAASRSPEVRRMNGTRLPGDGPLGGHTPKNILLTGLMLEHGVREGVKEFATMMQANGTFEPVTETPHELVLHDDDKVIVGEHLIDTHVTQSPEPWISHEPPVHITKAVEQAVLESDRTFYASGSPLTSQLAALCVGGMREALHRSAAEKVLIANLANEPHDTPNWHVVDYVRLLLRHNIPVDTVLYNTATDIVEAAGQQSVDISLERFSELPQIHFIGAPLVASAAHKGRVTHDAAAIVGQLSGTVDKSVV